MSAYTTLYISRSRAIEEYRESVGIDLSDIDKLLEEFLDRKLESSLFNAIVVDDESPNDDGALPSG